MDLVDDQGIPGQNVAILEPPPRDTGGDDDDVPGRQFRRRFALAIDDAHPQVGRAENGFRDRSHGERFPRAGSGDDTESLSRGSELEDLLAMLALENGVEMKSKSEFDCLARSARRRDDENTPRRRLGGDERVVVGREVTVVRLPEHAGARMRSLVRQRRLVLRHARAAAALPATTTRRGAPPRW